MRKVPSDTFNWLKVGGVTCALHVTPGSLLFRVFGA
jgi:hypothetical protein